MDAEELLVDYLQKLAEAVGSGLAYNTDRSNKIAVACRHVGSQCQMSWKETQKHDG